MLNENDCRRDNNNINNTNNMNNTTANKNNNSNAEQWQPWPPTALSMAHTALTLTSQEWSLTGHGSHHPSVSTNNYNSSNITNAASLTIVDEVTERMVSLLLVRVVALVSCRLGNTAVQHSIDNNTTNNNNNNNNEGERSTSNVTVTGRRASHESSTSSKTGTSQTTTTTNNSGTNNSTVGVGGYYRRMKDKMYADFSTSTICRSALKTALRERERMREMRMLELEEHHYHPSSNLTSIDSRLRAANHSDLEGAHLHSTSIMFCHKDSRLCLHDCKAYDIHCAYLPAA